MIITMLICFYLFVFQYFNFNLILCFQLISFANIQLFSFFSILQKQIPLSLCNLFGVHG